MLADFHSYNSSFPLMLSIVNSTACSKLNEMNSGSRFQHAAVLSRIALALTDEAKTW